MYVGWVCCWFSSFLWGFFFGFSGFPPSTKINIMISKSNSIWKQWMKSHLVEMPLEIPVYFYFYYVIYFIYNNNLIWHWNKVIFCILFTLFYVQQWQICLSWKVMIQFSTHFSLTHYNYFSLAETRVINMELHYLFLYFSLDDILLLISCILTQQRIVFLSSSYSLLTPIIEVCVISLSL